ncbi:MAG: helix-turn-helix domain-containing protein [Rubrivivax sp.]|nr:helix-turn-helix domain-containing protein [Rubrivivax sp.]
MSYPDPLMTKTEVATLLRCSERTIERQVKHGEFPPPQRFGREALWFQSVVFAWIDKRRVAQQAWQSPALKPDAGGACALQTESAKALVAVPDTRTVGPKLPVSRAQPWQGAAAAEPLFKLGSGPAP